MRRIHYSAEPLDAVHSVSQKADERTYANGKPAGLWYSIGEAWREWCSGEEFGLSRLVAPTVLDLDLSRFLLINSVPSIERFAEEYGCELYPDTRLQTRVINWSRVAERFAGIEINPYLWPARLDPRFSWYYGWDCASGCVWDATAVLAFKPLRRVSRPQQGGP